MVTSQALKKLRLLGALPDRALEALAPACSVRRYERAAAIYREGTAGTSIYFVQDGRVKVLRALPDGQEQLLCVWEAGDGFGLMVALDGAPYPSTAVAADDCQVVVIPVAALRDHPEVLAAVARAVAHRMRGQQERLGHMAARSGPGRLAALLLHLQAEAGRPLVAGGLTQQELGAMVGLNRETVSRSLARLREEGLIRVELGGIRLLDPEGLAAIAGL